MNHQDIAKLMIIAMCLASCGIIGWYCRPIWTVRFKGRIESEQFRAFTRFGLDRQADAFRSRHRLGTYKVRKGGH